jgi:hypothetical protein
MLASTHRAAGRRVVAVDPIEAAAGRAKRPAKQPVLFEIVLK